MPDAGSRTSDKERFTKVTASTASLKQGCTKLEHSISNLESLAAFTDNCRSCVRYLREPRHIRQQPTPPYSFTCYRRILSPTLRAPSSLQLSTAAAHSTPNHQQSTPFAHETSSNTCSALRSSPYRLPLARMDCRIDP